MDHKVSKDMISSGMIPSGEKTQADLGRTQYGSAPSPNALLDAYKSMYEHHKKDADGNTIPHEGEELNEGKIPSGQQAYLDKKKGKKEDKKDVKEMAGMSSVDKMKGQITARKTELSNLKDDKRERLKKVMKDFGEGADLFDIVSTYFIEEGYDKKDVYEAMSSVDLSEEVQDLHEVIPLIGAALAGAGKLAAGLGVKAAAAGATKAAAAGATKAAAAGATKAAAAGAGKAAIAKGGLGRMVTRAGIKLGGKTGGKIANTIKKNPMTSYMVARDMTSGIQGGGAGQTRTSSISASADLFDIVKGQLLDEGMSEEEIKDIMLTLTPDEILSEYKDVPAGQMNYASYGVPKPKSYEMDSLKRQTAPGGGKDYKIEDKKNVVAYNQKKIAREEYKGSGTPEQQAAMKAQVEISKKVIRYGGKTPSGTTAVDAKKGIEDVRKSM